MTMPDVSKTCGCMTSETCCPTTCRDDTLFRTWRPSDRGAPWGIIVSREEASDIKLWHTEQEYRVYVAHTKCRMQFKGCQRQPS